MWRLLRELQRQHLAQLRKASIGSNLQVLQLALHTASHYSTNIVPNYRMMSESLPCSSKYTLRFLLPLLRQELVSFFFNGS